MVCLQPSDDRTWVYSPLHYTGSKTLPGDEEESDTVSVNHFVVIVNVVVYTTTNSQSVCFFYGMPLTLLLYCGNICNFVFDNAGPLV